MQVHLMVFWPITLCSYVVEHQRFGRPYYLHLQGEYNITIRCYNPEDKDMNISPLNPTRKEFSDELIVGIIFSS